MGSKLRTHGKQGYRGITALNLLILRYYIMGLGNAEISTVGEMAELV